MTTPPAYPGPEWLDANAIAARTGGIRRPNTVRTWWNKKDNGLAFEVFATLSPKSNKRSHRDVVDTYLRSLGITPYIPPGKTAGDHGVAAPRADTSGTLGAAGQPRLADVLDALMSVKAAADAAMEAIIVEAQGAALQTDAAVQQAQATAQQAHTRLQTYKKLQTMLHGYDMALSVLVHPHSPPDAPSSTD
ncbi:hypothetical protein ABFW00_08055 [Mycobacteroides abscessus]|uniref:hypothetical protein n=1 Tax=Mycobacteroides abscessus TaxID=36809 RepID=UPI0011A10B5B|nr:hypothetical protein [Mycobacteroides abscessus]